MYQTMVLSSAVGRRSRLALPGGIQRNTASCWPACPQQGFTLIELMVVVLIIAILASIALPSYTSYVKRSRAKSASADLVALGLNFENHFQRTLNYPTEDQSTTTTAATKALMPGWSASQEQFFTYSVATTTTSYELKAAGTGAMDGCDLTLTNDNTRTVSGASACGGFSSW